MTETQNPNYSDEPDKILPVNDDEQYKSSTGDLLKSLGVVKPKQTLEQQFQSEYGGYELEHSYHMRAKKLIDGFRESPAVIYYPGSNIDISFTKLFPTSRVVHTDTEDNAIMKLQEAQYEAYAADMHEFVPSEFADVVVIFNAGYMTQEELEKVTKPGSIVVVNNYHNAATFMRDECPDFSLVGSIMKDNPTTIVRDFDVAELGVLPKQGEIVWPSHSETIFAFQRQETSSPED